MIDFKVLIRRYKHQIPSEYKLPELQAPQNLIKNVYKLRVYIREFTLFKKVYLCMSLKGKMNWTIKIYILLNTNTDQNLL